MVHGVRKSYKVNLKQFECECGIFACKHLFATAIYFRQDIADFFPDSYKIIEYKKQLDSCGEYPSSPSSAAVDSRSDLFDETLHIPICAKRRQGRPKKNERIIGAREKAIMENRKMDQVKKN